MVIVVNVEYLPWAVTHLFDNLFSDFAKNRFKFGKNCDETLKFKYMCCGVSGTMFACDLIDEDMLRGILDCLDV